MAQVPPCAGHHCPGLPESAQTPVGSDEVWCVREWCLQNGAEERGEGKELGTRHSEAQPSSGKAQLKNSRRWMDPTDPDVCWSWS